ncbi:hypothetical protein [Parvularcula sp. LCG005]|uniref:hypothetical protein n=1 Tax=Parvularcula sp. LCG005 TaxID=3078805 RepID=UPI0029431CD8|nr:hypothetical protein [Parvularcula sp. LCG005]WOI54287.1 hypothetical protein RUI03_04625 [Parvularcula sp. LCG005]
MAGPLPKLIVAAVMAMTASVAAQEPPPSDGGVSLVTFGLALAGAFVGAALTMGDAKKKGRPVPFADIAATFVIGVVFGCGASSAMPDGLQISVNGTAIHLADWLVPFVLSAGSVPIFKKWMRGLAETGSGKD